MQLRRFKFSPELVGLPHGDDLTYPMIFSPAHASTACARWSVVTTRGAPTDTHAIGRANCYDDGHYFARPRGGMPCIRDRSELVCRMMVASSSTMVSVSDLSGRSDSRQTSSILRSVSASRCASSSSRMEVNDRSVSFRVRLSPGEIAHESQSIESRWTDLHIASTMSLRAGNFWVGIFAGSTFIISPYPTSIVG